jgi:hypothetical protein
MVRQAMIPAQLRYAPFRGSVAIARGVLTRGQLAGPAWRRLFPDVYIFADAPMDHLTWCRAAGLALPAGAALSHRSAAYLFGVNLLPRAALDRVELTVPTSARPRISAVTIHRSRLPIGDVARRGGLPVTNRWRTAFDLGRSPDLAASVAALDAMLFRRVIKHHELREIAADRKGWPGVVHFRTAAGLARAGVESVMETRLRLVVVRGGLPEPAVQVPVFDTSGLLVARLDLAYEALRVGLEYDGDHHRERGTFQRDAVRLNRLHLCGWTVLRFTADDVLRHPERVVAQVRRVVMVATSGAARRL